ncbi:biotin transporter BioY [Dokdonella fugitiva]|uniref:Biotin transporter BioY n=1 Tax=Dokdonella fugitiva TaxID=328517 RepID=A0A839F3U9_9GAMM|nr:hypothetical protein [Dokdonella fugitiva]MBA8888702.1 biotin transporter BioY [Dokdonella fugitiva]
MSARTILGRCLAGILAILLLGGGLLIVYYYIMGDESVSALVEAAFGFILAFVFARYALGTLAQTSRFLRR